MEELDLKSKKIDHLGSLDTVWEKKNKLVHYFVGRVPYNSDELEGVIQLQWEVSEYFCGDLEEIEEKMGEGATQNLKNAIEFYKQENLVLERAYAHSAGHSGKKRRLIGLGGSKNTGSHKLKRVKNFKRSDSSPVGFGGLEESEQKKVKKIKISIVSNMDEKKKRKKRKKKRKTSKNRGRGAGSAWPYGGSGVIGSHGDGDGGGNGGGE